MKLPKTPPKVATILQTLSPERQLEIFSTRLPQKNEYRHWDKLRYLATPEGVTHEEWWCLLKIRRKGNSSPIPLLDKKGLPFTHYQTGLMNQVLHKIDLGAGGAIGVPEPVTNEETKNYYYVNSLMQEAITSSQLEGAAVTREVAKEMIRTSRKPTDIGERMIVNNYRTMERLREWKDYELSPALIYEIHELITEGALDDATASGRLRNESEMVDVIDQRDGEVMHNPPDASELPERLQRLCDYANKEDEEGFTHPVVKAIILHFWLAYDHPFVDGNGRTARALFYWYLLRHGFWLFEYLSISQILVKAPIKYSRSYLYTETDENDLNYFIHYQLEVIQKSVEKLHEYIEHKSSQVSEAREVLLKLEIPLNHRQEAIVQKAMRDPRCTFSISSHRKSHRIAYGTARSDLLYLESKDILVSQKQGKTHYFYPAPDLDGRLKTLKS